MIKFLDQLTIYSPLISAVIAFSNLLIVIQVFSFNRRMSQSKLSVSSSLKPYFLSTKPDTSKPNQFGINSEYKEERLKHTEWLDSLDYTYHLHDFNNIPHRLGLPLHEEKLLEFKDREDVKSLSISISNTGDLPSRNVRVKLLFKTYGTKNFYPKTPLPTELVEREVFSERSITIPVAYMGANDQRTFSICDLHGQFRETELILLSIKSNGFTYVRNNLFKKFFRLDSEIILNHYVMDKLNLLDLTEHDLRIIYGLKTTDTEK